MLIDCNEEVMEKRLNHDRKQPELVNNDMKKWLTYLRNQASDLGIHSIDTSNITKEDVVKCFEKALENRIIFSLEQKHKRDLETH
jgi:hypothetical protein